MAETSTSRPNVSSEQAKRILLEKYCLKVTVIKELKSHDDRNFYIEARPIDSKEIPPGNGSDLGKSYVLKIVRVQENVESEKSEIINQLNFMQFMGKCEFTVPQIQETMSGERVFVENASASLQYLVFLLTFLDGITVYDTYKHTSTPTDVLLKLGQMLAAWRSEVKSYGGIQYEAPAWRLDNTGDFKERLALLEEKEKISLSRTIISAFETEVMQHIPNMESGMNHGDFHDENIVILKNPPGGSSRWTEFAILDFRDTGTAPFLFDLATSIAFFMMMPSKDQKGFIDVGGHFLCGYTKTYPLCSVEWQCLYLSICMAYVRELVVGESDYITQGKSNEYLLTTNEIGWSQLKMMWNIGETDVLERFQRIKEYHD